VKDVKGRILLVDDNEEFLDSTKDVLEEEGYQVVTAGSGEEAIREVELADFDVVLMDIKMQGLNGVDTFMEMKKRKSGVKVIMCTAYIVENLIRRALEEGACAVLNKPFDMDLLFRTIVKVGQSGSPATILVADRDNRFCLEVQRVFGSQGHRVVIAHDGRDALEKAETYSFDVLLLDLRLPPADGLEIHRQIRAKQPATHTTIIVGHPDEMDSAIQQELRKENGLTTMIRPVDITQLQELLAELCGARRL